MSLCKKCKKEYHSWFFKVCADCAFRLRQDKDLKDIMVLWPRDYGGRELYISWIISFLHRLLCFGRVLTKEENRKRLKISWVDDNNHQITVARVAGVYQDHYYCYLRHLHLEVSIGELEYGHFNY